MLYNGEICIHFLSTSLWTEVVLSLVACIAAISNVQQHSCLYLTLPSLKQLISIRNCNIITVGFDCFRFASAVSEKLDWCDFSESSQKLHRWLGKCENLLLQFGLPWWKMAEIVLFKDVEFWAGNFCWETTSPNFLTRESNRFQFASAIEETGRSQVLKFAKTETVSNCRKVISVWLGAQDLSAM